jgi:hypothetical protein
MAPLTVFSFLDVAPSPLPFSNLCSSRINSWWRQILCCGTNFDVTKRIDGAALTTSSDNVDDAVIGGTGVVPVVPLPPPVMLLSVVLISLATSTMALQWCLPLQQSTVCDLKVLYWWKWLLEWNEEEEDDNNNNIFTLCIACLTVMMTSNFVLRNEFWCHQNRWYFQNNMTMALPLVLQAATIYNECCDYYWNEKRATTTTILNGVSRVWLWFTGCSMTVFDWSDSRKSVNNPLWSK